MTDSLTHRQAQTDFIICPMLLMHWADNNRRNTSSRVFADMASSDLRVVVVIDCRNLLHQLIEPNPQLRIPLSEVICHPWVTKNGKAPFATYTAPPRNKMLRNQVNTFVHTCIGCFFLSVCMFFHASGIISDSGGCLLYTSPSPRDS